MGLFPLGGGLVVGYIASYMASGEGHVGCFSAGGDGAAAAPNRAL